MTVWRFDLAKECFEKAGDLSALMLLLVAMGDRDGLKVLAAKAGKVPFSSNITVVLIDYFDRGERSEQSRIRYPATTWRFCWMCKPINKHPTCS